MPHETTVNVEQLFAIIGRKVVENMLLTERISKLTEANQALSQELTRLQTDRRQPAETP